MKNENKQYGYEHSTVVENKIKISSIGLLIDEIKTLFEHSQHPRHLEKELPYEISSSDFAHYTSVVSYVCQPYSSSIGLCIDRFPSDTSSKLLIVINVLRHFML